MTKPKIKKRPGFGLDFLFVYCDAGLSPLPLKTFLPPLGPIQLASFLEDRGFRCRVVDARREDFTIEWFAGYLSTMRPRWVGMSVFTDTVFTAARLARVVRIASPSSRVAAGGAHATVCDEETLADLGADVVVRGEGEIPCAELLTKGRLSDVSGITFRRGRGIVRTPPPPPIDLDIIPSPDFGLVLGIEEMPYVPAVSTGRGCPYRCTFCAAGILNPHIRWRSVDKVVGDIASVQRQLKSSYLVIVDDTFTVSPERTAEFCRAIKEIGGGRDIFWYAEGRVDRLAKNLHLLSTMRDAGLVLLQLGIESGDERVLEAYKKRIAIADAIKLCEACAREKILTHAGFIVGGPFESDETIAKTRELALKLIEVSRGYLQTRFDYLNPLPGTEIFIHPERYGIRLLDPNLYSSVGFDNCVTETLSLAREEVIRRRVRIMGEMALAAHLKVKGADGESREYFQMLLDKLGAVHNSLTSHKVDDWDSHFRGWFETTRRKAEGFPQFATSAGKSYKGLIPARMHMFSVDDGGRYCVPVLGARMDDLESDVFHYSSGKLTAKDIAVILGRKPAEIGRALKSMEEKKVILYRTY